MFKKSDFKNGMIVEFNNGKRRMIWDDKLIDNIGFIWMANIDEKDLRHLDSIKGEFIDRIYKTYNIGSMNDFFRDDSLTEIWNRYR
jgi:hypothetical protein